MNTLYHDGRVSVIFADPGVGSRKVGIEFRSDNPHGMAMIIKHRYADPAVGTRKVDIEFSLR